MVSKDLSEHQEAVRKSKNRSGRADRIWLEAPERWVTSVMNRSSVTAMSDVLETQNDFKVVA